jgi:integrase
MSALPYAEAPEFMKQLRAIDTVSARALEFTILTASRTKPIRFMTWNQLDLDNKVWTVPASLMKTKKEFRVALSEQALALLNTLPRVEDYVFLGGKAGNQ